MNDILTILWLSAPFAFGNMGPVIVKNIPLFKKFNQPLDFGKSFRGKRIFGNHKTIRGIVAGTTLGLLVVLVQMLLYAQFSGLKNYSYTVDYSNSIVILMGILMGFGAVTGDAIKSFFKRQINIEPGRSWVPFDQLDSVVGGLVAALPFFVLSFRMYVLCIFLALILHPTINIISWILRLQDKPF